MYFKKILKVKEDFPLNRRQTVFVNGTVLIENLIREEDEGDYRCEVQDEQNRIAERSVSVRILSMCFLKHLFFLNINLSINIVSKQLSHL